MPFKNKQDKNNWQKNYYHNHNLKEVQSKRARMNYWIKKYCKLMKITISEFKASFRAVWSEERLKDNCKEMELNLQLNKERY